MNKKRLLTLVLLSTLIIGFISLFFVEIGSNPVKINNDSDNIDSPKKLVFNDLDGLRTSTSNVLSSKYLTINDKDNLYDSVYYWVNGSLYDSTNIFKDFQSGKLQTEYGTYSALNQNYTLLNDMNNDYWSNYSNNYDPTMGNGSYNDANGTFSSTNIGFNYDYLYHTSTNYNYSLYNQIFTAPDGSMSHNYQPDGYNSSYTINNKLYMQDLFPNEQFWEMWDSYSTTYDPSYTNSSFNKYNFITNATVEPGNGQWISGGINELKYYDSQYYKAKSSLYSGNQILYVDFDFTDGTPKWGELDGDYFLYFSCNTSMNFRDGNHETLWSGSQANGVYITDVDDWIYIFKEQVSPAFSIQIDYLFLLDPKLASELNDFVNYTVASNSSFYLLNGTLQSYGDLKEIDNDFSYNPLYNTGELTAGLTANIDDGGSRDWVDTDYSKISDDNRALCWNIPKNYGHGDYLEVYGFPSNIPSGSTIKGFIVQIEKKTNRSSSITDHHVQLVRAGIIEGTDKAKRGTYWQTFDGWDTYGANGDLWGLTWTVDQANNVGVVIGAENYDVTHAANAYVDVITINIYYNPPPPNCSVFQSGNSISDYPAHESFNNMTTNYGEYWDERFTNKTTTEKVYYNSPDNFNLETPKAITLAGDIAWVDAILLPNNCKASLDAEYDNHKNVLNLTHDAGANDPYLMHYFDVVQTSGTYEFWWCNADADDSTYVIFMSSLTNAIFLVLQSNKYYFYNGSLIEISGVTPVDSHFDHFKVVFDCSTDTFDLYINGILRVDNGYFGVEVSSINRVKLYFNSNVADSTYLSAPSEGWDANYVVGYNLNPYDITQLIAIPTTYWGFVYGITVNITSNYLGHEDVLVEKYMGTSTPYFYPIYSLSKTSGSMEFWYLTGNNTKGVWFDAYDNSWNQLIPIWFGIGEYIKYYNGTTWITLVAIGSNCWQHIRIDFETGSGAYQSLSADTWQIYVNGTKYGDYAFSNGVNANNVAFVRICEPTSTNTIHCFDSICFSWDTNYLLGDNINSYNISAFKSKGWTMNYALPSSYVRIDASIGGHNNVIELFDNTGAKDSSNDYVKFMTSFTAQASGTIEFWIRSNNTGDYYMIYIKSGSSNRISIILSADKFQYYYGSWIDIPGATVVDNVWYHIRIEFECGTGQYKGLAPDKFNFYLNGMLKGSGLGFEAATTTLNNLIISTTDWGYSSTQIIFLDAIAFSWIPGYTIGSNMYNVKLDFISTIQAPDLYNKYSNDTFDYITLHYSFKTNISTVVSIYAYNFISSDWVFINSSVNKNGFYDCVFSLSSNYFNSTKYFKIRIIGGNDTGNRFELYLEMLRIDYKWTKTSGNIYTILSKTTIFDFLNHYDTGFDDYLKLFKFDYIFTYRYTNFTAYTKVAKFNGVSLTTDGSWHTADFYSIYDSSTGDGTIDLEFNISNGLLEVRTFKYTMWFGCIDAVNGRRQLQQIFSVEWPYGGSLSDYVAENGMFFINVKYNFTTVNDGYLYTNTYDRHNKLEIHYAVKADGTWYYAMWSTNTSISTNTRIVNVTDMMKSLGLEKFEDFAVTFIMIGNNSKLYGFNVSLWDKRAVVPAKLNLTVYHDFSVSDYVLDYMKLLYGWNTTNYNLVNIYIYCVNNGSWYLLKTGYNKGVITYNTFETYTLYAKYIDSNNKTYIKVECGQNYTHNYKLNLRTKYNYRTGVWVSYELAFDERGIWRYRFVLVSSGVEYYTSWVYFDVVEPKPNFRAVSSSDYITTWVLTQNATSSEILRFEDDLDYGAWILTSPSNKYLSYNVQPNDDGYVSNWSPNQNYGWSSSIDIMTLVGSGHPGGITYGFVEDSHAETYLNDNNTASRPQSTFNLYAWYDPYWEEPLGSGSTNWYYTYDFNENTLTWNNMPAQNGFLVNLPYPGIWTWGQISLNYKLPIYLRIQPGDSTSDLRFDSAEGAQGYKCYFTHYVPKSYHNSTLKYWYMQTSISETLEMTSPEYPTGTQVYTNDYIKVDCQTTSSSMDVIFLLGGVPVKTVPLMRGNTNYNRQIVEVLLDSDVYFDQIRFSGPFSTGKYFKCFDVKILGLDKKSESVVERDVANEAEIFALAGINCLKIYERGILKVSKYVTLSYDYNELWVETYIGSLLGECHFAYQDENNEPLSFDYFKTHVNYTADNSTILNEQLFTNFLYVDENTYITFTVYDTFDVVILTTTQMERIFVELILPVYSLKIQNGATEQVYYALTKNTSSVAKSGKMFSSEIVEYKIASGDYNLAYINYEDSIVRNTNFTLANNKLISINTTYYQLYVSCFNFDGLGLDTDWVRLYINNLRKDFGFNALKTDYTRFVVLDFFNATLTNETVCTRIYTEYNLYIQVYNMILNNNYTHSIFITIERPSVNITIKQIIPAQSSINYRFLPGIDYNISYYYINGTRIGSVNITLVDNNQIVSFGYYSVEVPSPYYQLLVSCFNYNGFKLDTTWVYLYVNGIRADFGFNVMGTEYNLFVITDLFGELLSSEIVYTKNLTQYNADVTIYGMILNNNYTHSIYIELTRPNMSLIMKQIMPAQSGALYRFCPDTDYVISYYYINGTKIDEIRVTLETDNQVVSFGWYAVEVPAGPSNELIMGQMWLDIVVIVSCFVVIITFTLYLLRKYIKRNKEQQKYIYNTNKSKTNLEVESLLGKTHYFK